MRKENNYEKLKIAIAFVLLLLILAGCTQGSTSTDSDSSIGETTALQTESFEIDPADSTFGLKDLSDDKCIFESDKVKVTFNDFVLDDYQDEYYFTVENKLDKSIVLCISGMTINGNAYEGRTDCSVEDGLVEAQKSAKITVIGNSFLRKETMGILEKSQFNCLDFTLYTVLADEFDKISEPYIYISATVDGHTHMADQRTIYGEIMYEDNDLAVYMNPIPQKDEDNKEVFYYSILNKTNRNIRAYIDTNEMTYINGITGMKFTEYRMAEMSSSLYIGPKALSSGYLSFHNFYESNHITNIEFGISACYQVNHYEENAEKLSADGKKIFIEVE